MKTPLKTCKRCKKGFTGEGNVCNYCKTGTKRPTAKWKGLCHKQEHEVKK